MTEAVAHKVLGTETEFGISILRQEDFNPVLASSLVINAYAGGRGRIQWSYEEETPGRDARGLGYEAGGAGEIETGLLNVVLTNGARLYVDHAHPEYSTPECYDPLEAALYDKAGELVMARAVAASHEILQPGQRVLIHKNNSDGKGNSYGSHENYLVARSVPFGDIVAHLTTFLVSRQIFTGSGKVGSENNRRPVEYQITQRADFFEAEVGLETTLKRPIINTRDEPHAEPGKYRRLHVIIGDANLCEVQTYLKLGATSLMLAALEAGALGEPIILEAPVESVWRVSHDISLQTPLRLADGSTATPIELQWSFLERVGAYAKQAELLPEQSRVLVEWEEVLTDLERDPLVTADRLDWTAKLLLLRQYAERHGLSWDDPRLRLLDLQYHDVDVARSLYHRLVAAGMVRRLFTAEQIADAAVNPPQRTRAFFRGRCIEKYGDAIVAANWDSLVFDVGENSLKRVPMMEPLRGSREWVADILDRSPTAADLICALGGTHG